MTALQFHPLADIFPLVEGAEFDELVADIREHGLHEPIVVFEDKILDGRNRYRACEAAGVEPTFTAYTGDDPTAYVVSLNLRRRHLDESQRAMVAAKLATLKLGDNQHSEGLPIGRSSELLNVGERTVARAREVQEHGTPELVSAVERRAVPCRRLRTWQRFLFKSSARLLRGVRGRSFGPHKISGRGKRRFAAPNALSGWPQPAIKALRSQATDAMRCFMPIRRGVSMSTMKNAASSARPATIIPRCRSMRSVLCQS